MKLKIFISVVFTGLFILFFLWISGSFDWPRGWIYIALLSLGKISSAMYLRKKNPDVLTARSSFGKGTKKWDKILMSFFGSFFLAILFVAAVDERFGWSSLQIWWCFVGSLLFLICEFGLAWTMGINPFFEKTVRIQDDRGHRVIDQGPYKIIRHPGYFLTIFGFLIPPVLILGSKWASLPAVLSIVCLVIRTAWEDRTLQNELPGYAEYAKRVQYKLFPGIW